MDAARGNHTIRYDAFPEGGFVKYGEFSPRAMLDKFGEQYANYLSYTWRMEKIRNACKIASQNVPENIRNWSRDLAALSMGCAYPMELTTKVFLQTFAKDRPVVRIAVQSATDEKKNHPILISGDISSIVNAFSPGIKLTEFLGELENCTILDPFVNSFSRLEDFDSSFANQYLQSLEADTVTYMDYIYPSEDALAEYRNIVAFAKDIENKARQIVSTPENTNELIHRIGSCAIGAKTMLGLSLDEFF